MRLSTWGIFAALVLVSLVSACNADLAGRPDGDVLDGDAGDGDMDLPGDGDTTPGDGDTDSKPDGDADGDGDEEELPPECEFRCVEVVPGTLDFGPVLPGDTVTRSFEIVSSGFSTVAVTAVSKSVSETSAEFEIVGYDPGPPPLDLPPRQRLRVDVAYTPIDLAEDSGRIMVVTDAEVSPRRDVILEMAYKGGAVLVVEPGSGIDWGERMANGQSYPEIFTIRATPDPADSNRPLEILAVELGLGDESPFALLPDGGCEAPFFMANGGRKSCYVVFKGLASGEFTDSLIVTASDYLIPEQNVEINLDAVGVVGQIEVNPLSVNFSYVRVDRGSVLEMIEVRNTGSGILSIQQPIWLENRDDSFDILDENGVMGSTLAPGARKVFALVYEPATITVHTAALGIRSNDPLRPTVELIASGIGVEECPAAMAPDPSNPAQCIPACDPGETICTYTAEGWGYQECLDSGGTLGPYQRCLEGQICVDGECLDLPCYLGERRCLDIDTEQRCGVAGWGENTECTTSDICYVSECRDGTNSCRKYASPPNTPCDDGSACTENNRCDGQGTCLGDPVNCNDDNPCTRNFCNVTTGCVVDKTFYNGQDCNDGNPCTSGDTCQNGNCTPLVVSIDCNDNNACTTDFCDPDLGCWYEYNSNPCDNGNRCTRDDYCDGGTCKAGPDVNCDDSNPCTTDSCNSTAGCINNFKAGGCEDGDPCTLNDYCATVNTVPTCVSGTRITCNDNNPCTASTCGPGGTCIHPDVPDGGACNDNNACTGVGTGATPDQCIGGQCVPGSARDCGDDGNPCTKDVCDPAIGCYKSNVGGPCDDLDPCTLDDYCQGGFCRAGATQLVCDDNNPCTQNRCHKNQDGCYFTAVTDGNPCDADNNKCTVGDKCMGGECEPGTGTLNCDDTKFCTDDTCDPLLGCRNVARLNDPCDDGNPCTVGDYCIASGACSPGLQTKNCDDGNFCTADTCVANFGCAYSPTNHGFPCDDNDPCTLGTTCVSGQCRNGTPNGCDDGNPCTVDSCDSQQGCVHTPRSGSCDDGDPCSIGDTCQPSGDTAVCVPGSEQLACNDGNQCTTNTCVPGTGCVTTNRHNLPCDDGNACTVGDLCEYSTCKPGSQRNCNDNNPCTSDSCDNSTGCVNTSISGTPGSPNCTDNNVCTLNDYCSEGTCVGSQISCEEGNPCTDNYCDPVTGCYAVNNTAPCNKDSNGCTVNDFCAGGACYAGTQANCSSESDQCNVGVCNSTGNNSYTCVKDPSPLHNQLCNADNNGCTYHDRCNQGACLPGSAVDCSSESDVCNTGVCVSTGPSDSYCTKNSVPHEGQACNDGNACTSASLCEGGICEATAFMPEETDCETDNNPCTLNQCNDSGECTHPPKQGVWQEAGDCPGRQGMRKVLCTNYCVDRYEAVICRTDNCTTDRSNCKGQGSSDDYWTCFNDNGNDGTCVPSIGGPNPRACSVSGETPSRYMTFDQAKKACENAGKQICSIDMWTRACSVSYSRTYPYGSTYAPLACNGADYGNANGGRAVRNTGALAGCTSPSGEFDMSGNVREWVSNGNYSQPNQHVFGGYFDSSSGNLTCSSYQDRAWDNTSSNVGFRCCVTQGP